MLVSQFQTSLTNHINKFEGGVNELIADLNNFTAAEQAIIKQFVLDNHPTVVDKINFIND